LIVTTKIGYLLSTHFQILFSLMDQLIYVFIVVVLIVLIAIVIMMIRMKKNNGAGSMVDQAGIQKELELTKRSFSEMETRSKKREELFREIENKYTRAVADHDNAVKNLDNEHAQVVFLKNKIEEQTNEVNLQKEERSKLSAQLKAQEERISTQKKEVEDIQKRFNDQFEILANKILEEKTKKFTEVNKERLDQILKPLSENLKEFEKVVRDSYDKEGKERHSLGEEVKKLMELNQAISQETKDLTEALKGSSKQQGDWGEMVLERILEQSGLTEGREYFVQESLRDETGVTIKNDEGKIMRPDVIVQYPDKRKVIIDSKVSLTAYVELTSSSEEEEQQRALKRHLLSINKHVDELSAKSYPEYGTELDFVMMFIPTEGAYIAAMQGNPNLWNEAYKKSVLLISPTNLIAALRLIMDMWDRDTQSKNAEKIADRGGKLYEKFVGYLQTMDELGNSIKKSQTSFDKAVSQLSEGRGNLVNQAQQLEKLGIKYNKSKQIPTDFVNDVDDSATLLNE